MIEATICRVWSWQAIVVCAGFAVQIHANYTDASLTLGTAFFLQQNSYTADLFPMPHCNGFKLEEATIDQMQKALNEGQINSQQLAACYLRRIYLTQDYIK